jgi:Na+-driven multidrug efflux pump
MLNIIGALVGLGLGLIVARRKGGNRLDMAQYAAVFAIIGFLLGTLAMLLVPAPV